MSSNESPNSVGGGALPSDIPPVGAQRIGVLKETFPLEKRVATIPEVVEKLIKLGFGVCIETGAGEAAN